MNYKLQLSEKTLKVLKKSEKATRKDILKVFEKIIQDPYRFKPLRYELKGCYRARFGKYRIIFEINDETIFILSIEHRKKVYK
jgi:mRNA-degrading endonuclease RelE of RelBE toxin-antitoxin system